MPTGKAGPVERVAVTTAVVLACLLSAIITARLLAALAGWFFDTTGATGLIVAGIVVAAGSWWVTRGERGR